MKIRTLARIVILLLIAAGFIAGGVSVGIMPERMASHWNIRGQADGFLGRMSGVFFLPVFMTAVTALLFFVPFLDPMRKAFATFRNVYEWFIAAVLVFFLAVHGFILAVNAGIRIPIEWVFSPAFCFLWIATGLLLPRLRRNAFAGIRTPWTLRNDEVWKRTHRLGRTLFLVSGASALGGFAGPGFMIAFAVLPVLAASLVLVGYSYAVFRKESRKRS